MVCLHTKKIKAFAFLLLILVAHYIISCETKKGLTMDEKIRSQLSIIDSLLRDKDFSLAIATAQDAAYHKGIGQEAPPFLTAADDTATVGVSAKDEKIAINIAGFYALECGIGVLCNEAHQKPTDCLQTIVDEKADSASILLLNRFANATWKAGQPFRDLNRITRPIFTVASFLPGQETAKDYAQVKTAAAKLLATLQTVKDSTADAQMQKIRSLLQSPQYALEMAAFTDAGYAASQQQAPAPFLSAREENAVIKKSVKEQKIATNLAGFYALECGLDYLVTTKKILPAVILQSIADSSINAANKNLFLRFANATWKAGQPFKGLAKIERETFTPFYFLHEADIEKDWVQIKTAAAMVLAKL